MGPTTDLSGKTIATQTGDIDATFQKYVACIKRRDTHRVNAEKLKKQANREWVQFYAAEKDLENLSQEMGLDNAFSSAEEEVTPANTKRRLRY